MRSFRDVLLVDGYNIINAWPSLRETARHSLEDARIELIDKLQEFQAYERIELILVFDAHMIKGGQERVEQLGGLKLVYTRENETADHYIERWSDRMKRI